MNVKENKRSVDNLNLLKTGEEMCLANAMVEVVKMRIEVVLRMTMLQFN